MSGRAKEFEVDDYRLLIALCDEFEKKSGYYAQEAKRLRTKVDKINAEASKDLGDTNADVDLTEKEQERIKEHIKDLERAAQVLTESSRRGYKEMGFEGAYSYPYEDAASAKRLRDRARELKGKIGVRHG